MIKKLLFPLCVMLIAIVGIASDSNATFLQTDELIIMIPDAQTGRNDQAITDALTAVPGVTVVDYCNSQHCFYLTVDRTQQPDNKNVFAAVQALGYAFEVKISGTIQEAQGQCADR